MHIERPTFSEEIHQIKQHNQDEVMMIALTSLSKRAPWLTRSNATCTQKLWMLTGMNTDEWETWLANPKPSQTQWEGRVDD